MLTFRVADSLTGRLVGRLHPTAWEWTDPLTGSAEGSFKIPLTDDADDVRRLADLTQPHIRQLVARDELGRYWFGGPILGDPERNGDVLTVPVGDWRAWFYAAPIRPNTDGSRREYVHQEGGTGQVEQCRAIADLALLGLDTIGAPRLVVDTPPNSGVLRDVTHRMFKQTGDAMDNVSRRDGAPDWWTYLTTASDDPQSVVAHLKIGYPERGLTALPLSFRYVLGVGGNLLAGPNWPRGSTPPSRVIGVGPAPPPGEEWAIAEDPGLEDGTRLAWDEVWQLPDGVNSPDSAFDHALARLDAHAEALGSVEVELDPAATDLGSWGPGDRARLVIADGWRDLDLNDRRILARTLSGTGGDVTGVRVTVNLSQRERDIDDPLEEIEGEIE